MNADYGRQTTSPTLGKSQLRDRGPHDGGSKMNITTHATRLDAATVRTRIVGRGTSNGTRRIGNPDLHRAQEFAATRIRPVAVAVLGLSKPRGSVISASLPIVRRHHLSSLMPTEVDRTFHLFWRQSRASAGDTTIGVQ